MTAEYVIVLTTLPADGGAETLARTLVEERLAACANLLPPMDSIYRWEGAIEQERERQVLLKTSRERLPALWERLRELHPYETPEFLVLGVQDGSDAYLRWLGESTA